VKLYYFQRDEFDRDGRNWMASMDKRLLVLLDVFRHMWGQPIALSPHRRALGRPGWPNPNSDHYYSEPSGIIYAADVLPAAMGTRTMAERAIKLATDLGFTSLGLYPHWSPRAGLHLGTRVTHRPGSPATWGSIRVDPNQPQQYVSLAEAMEHMPT
jgi:hypothetical protein